MDPVVQVPTLPEVGHAPLAELAPNQGQLVAPRRLHPDLVVVIVVVVAQDGDQGRGQGASLGRVVGANPDQEVEPSHDPGAGLNLDQGAGLNPDQGVEPNHILKAEASHGHEVEPNRDPSLAPNLGPGHALNHHQRLIPKREKDHDQFPGDGVLHLFWIAGESRGKCKHAKQP